MGNQAQQGQELELWQVVSSPGNVRARRTKAGRNDAHGRGNISSRDRTMAVENARPAGRVRTGNVSSGKTVRTRGTRPAGTVRAEYARPSAMVKAGNARSSATVKAEYARPVSAAGTVIPRSARAVGTVNPRSARAARTASSRPAYASRTADPRTVRTANSKVQPSKNRKAGRRSHASQIFAVAWILLMCTAIFFMGKIFYDGQQTVPKVKTDKPPETGIPEEIPVVADTGRKPDIREDFLTISEYNRPGTELACVKNIFVHYTANPKTSAAQNRSYFENLGVTHERAASAHFIIGYEGEIIQCIPLDEEAYAVVERNGDSISIECCYLAQDGSFTQETYDSLVEMLAWLLDLYDLEPEDILRHYDCGGKLCPIYYVKHEDAWQKLLEDVAQYKLSL